MKFKFFKNFSSLEDVKILYRELAKQHHPDRGGDVENMKQINNEYEYIIKNRCFSFRSEHEEQNFDESSELLYPEIINQLLNLIGINIELCGAWLWISGATYPHKDRLKEIGCLYAPKKMMWYYRPQHLKRKKTKSLEMELIRRKYGSVMIEGTKKGFELT